MTLYEKIAADHYRPQGIYPRKPERPDVLVKRVVDLTADEMGGLVAVKAEYESRMAEYKRSVEEWNREEARLREQFWADLRADNGVYGDDPFVQQTESMAWDRGHSAGMGEVAAEFGNLMPLFELYAAQK
jgi:hypothetical protein